jgi:8-oxo-dGTP pyrophosphatase MutT (NUDIX family)
MASVPGRMTDEASPIRDAATIILIRRMPDGPSVLMGQRGSAAAFMPDKVVFPGGATDPDDATGADTAALSPDCDRRLTIASNGTAPATLAAAALRELAEETGLTLRAGPLPPLTFVFRAITPPGRSRRFDARFFLADAADLSGDPDDFSRAQDELSFLRWVPLALARGLNLPFITEIVLAEITHRVTSGASGPPPRVPFFDNAGPVPAFRWLE